MRMVPSALKKRHPRRFAWRLGARRCAGRNVYVPRRVEHEITRNEMTHPPRIIPRKRLIKVHGARRDAHEQKPIPPSRTDVRASTHTRAHPGIGIRAPSPTLLTNPVLCLLSPWSPALSSSRGDERARMLCNFDNQSHERRLIFIMITAASTSRMGTRPPIGGTGGEGERGGRGRIPLETRNKGAASLSGGARGTRRLVSIGVIRESTCPYRARISRSASRAGIDLSRRGSKRKSCLVPSFISGGGGEGGRGCVPFASAFVLCRDVSVMIISRRWGAQARPFRDRGSASLCSSPSAITKNSDKNSYRDDSRCERCRAVRPFRYQPASLCCNAIYASLRRNYPGGGGGGGLYYR